MNVQLYKFTEDKNKNITFRWTKKHFEFCMDNKIFLNHKGKKSYKERNLFLFSKGDKISIEENVIAEEYSTMPEKKFFQCRCIFISNLSFFREYTYRTIL